MSTAELINWVPASNPPDSDITVMLFDPAASEPVWLGYMDAHGWVYVDGNPAQPAFWAHMPKGQQP